MARPLVIFLHSSRYDRTYQAVNLLLTASSMGRPCHLFLFYGALGKFAARQWDEVDVAPADGGAPEWTRTLQRAFELGEVPSLYDLIERAREEPGGLKVLACSASMRWLELEPARVREQVDEIVGHATMLDVASGADILYI